MEDEEDDMFLLNNLGVESANPEDIERNILLEAGKDGGKNDTGKCVEAQFGDEEQASAPFSASHMKLLTKLKAVEVEIDAVAETIEHARAVARTENDVLCGSEKFEGTAEVKTDEIQDSVDGLGLQHALASDRLSSLRKTKALIQNELINLDKNLSIEDSSRGELVDKLVREVAKQNQRLKEAKPSRQISKKNKKAVSFDGDDFDAVLDAASAGFVETEREELVRKGFLTPFHKLKGFERRLQQPPALSRHDIHGDGTYGDLTSASVAKTAKSIVQASQSRPTTKLLDAGALPKLEAPTRPFHRLPTPLKFSGSLGTKKQEDKRHISKKRKRPTPGQKWRKVASQEKKNLAEGNDGNLGEEYISCEEENLESNEDRDIIEPAHVTLEGGLKIPKTIFDQLFDYQKVGVQWLWELHCQRAGGIIGDEMGLGKTIQLLSFLGALHFSCMYKPSIVICPVTLLQQWRREALKWYPSFHVEILHDSAQLPANGKRLSKSDESDGDSDSDSESERNRNKTKANKTDKKWDLLIDRVLRSKSGLLITTYEQLRLLGEKLLDIEWGYAVLDEGHRIRNPNAEVTLVCKQLQTVHRIIMTGAPIQNKLTELWSLFDFVFPGKLGVLPVFETEFAVPISVGGYANATPLQVSTAYRCAVVLRDLIMPYLLRRLKEDVNAHLPKKTEHVLFCSLTEEQRSIYRAFLASSEVEQIFEGNRNSLYGIDVMRKICNHPDILEREQCAQNPDYGNPERSGKMKVVAQVLKVWKDQGHRVLLFTQTQQMLDILENFLIANGYAYRRMDGLTPVKQRMALIDEFNNCDDVFIFILTTKVGGLGTNLIGANRIIIFDPDWNPSTDMQARERAWRIGQKRDVTVYRLITRGTIEEKVYHRQIYKHFLTNKILKNPQQKRFFKARDMKDLFTLQDDGEDGSTETSNIFSHLTGDVTFGVHNDARHGKRSASTSGDTSARSLDERSSVKGKEKAESDNEMDEETNVLKSLFDAHGIHSAMDHDVIINANDEEKGRLEEQASRVARKAAEALRQSRMLRSQDSVSVPTWTGRSGAAGMPSTSNRKFGSTINPRLLSSTRSLEGSTSGGTSKRPGFLAGASSGKALSSAELLSRMRGTEEKAIQDGLEHQFALRSHSEGRMQPSAVTHKSSKVFNKPDVLIDQLCMFIQLSGGHTTSAALVRHFKDKVPSKDLALFKNLLKEIATLKKDSGEGKWILKPEYRQRDN